MIAAAFTSPRLAHLSVRAATACETRSAGTIARGLGRSPRRLISTAYSLADWAVRVLAPDGDGAEDRVTPGGAGSSGGPPWLPVAPPCQPEYAAARCDVEDTTSATELLDGEGVARAVASNRTRPLLIIWATGFWSDLLMLGWLCHRILLRPL